MNLLIATDIFGKTPALEALANQLAAGAGSSVIVDPYGGVNGEFDSEAEAYATFQRTVGLEAYIEMVSTAIERLEGPVFLVGFSVGASAVWALSDNADLEPGTRAYCFYGSQIRRLAGVSPRIEVTLVFPKHEPHFDVAALSARLSRKRRVSCVNTCYLHGFMNRCSVHFDPKAYAQFSLWLQAIIVPGF